MSDDINTRLREKAMQIAALNQRLETIQAQLSGSVRRATQLNQQVQTLEQSIEKKDTEIQRLRAELQKAQGALKAMGQEVKGMRSSQPTTGAPSPTGGHQIEDIQHQLDIARTEARQLKDDLAKISSAAMDVITEKEHAVEGLKKALLEHGDYSFRVLGIVLQKRNATIDDLAAMLSTSVAEVHKIVDKLQAEDEVELGPNNTVIPAKKYREAQIPLEKWKSASPDAIFDDLLSIIGRTEGHENVAMALETAVDIIEQKMARGGALIFEMRRTANSWKSGPGDLQDLEFKIRQWKARAQAMS